MTAAKKPTVQKVTVKPRIGSPAKAAAPAAPAEPPPPIIDTVRKHANEIMARWAAGESLEKIGQSLEHKVSAMQIRLAIRNDEQLHERWAAVREHRAHYLIEAAADDARYAAASGEYKAAADIRMKLAAKLAPELYGEKATIAHTGADGGPIQSTVTLTPDEAYKRMLGNGG